MLEWTRDFGALLRGDASEEDKAYTEAYLRHRVSKTGPVPAVPAPSNEALVSRLESLSDDAACALLFALMTPGARDMLAANMSAPDPSVEAAQLVELQQPSKPDDASPESGNDDGAAVAAADVDIADAAIPSPEAVNAWARAERGRLFRPRWAARDAPAMTAVEASPYNDAELTDPELVRHKMLAMCGKPRSGKTFGMMAMIMRDLEQNPGSGSFLLVNVVSDNVYCEYVKGIRSIAETLGVGNIVFDAGDLPPAAASRGAEQAGTTAGRDNKWQQLRGRMINGLPYILVLRSQPEHTRLLLRIAEDLGPEHRHVLERRRLTFDESQNYFSGRGGKLTERNLIEACFGDVPVAAVRAVSATVVDLPDVYVHVLMAKAPHLFPPGQAPLVRVVRADPDKLRARGYFDALERSELEVELPVRDRQVVVLQGANGRLRRRTLPEAALFCRENMYGRVMAAYTAGWEQTVEMAQMHPVMQRLHASFFAAPAGSYMFETGFSDVNTPAGMDKLLKVATRLSQGRVVGIVQEARGVAVVRWRPEAGTWDPVAFRALGVPDLIHVLQMTGGLAETALLWTISNSGLEGIQDFNAFPTWFDADYGAVDNGAGVEVAVRLPGTAVSERTLPFYDLLPPGYTLHGMRELAGGLVGEAAVLSEATARARGSVLVLLPDPRPGIKFKVAELLAADMPAGPSQETEEEARAAMKAAVERACALGRGAIFVPAPRPQSPAPVGYGAAYSRGRVVTHVTLSTSDHVNVQKAYQAAHRASGCGLLAGPDDTRVVRMAALRSLYESMRGLEEGQMSMLEKAPDHAGSATTYTVRQSRLWTGHKHTMSHAQMRTAPRMKKTRVAPAAPPAPAAPAPAPVVAPVPVPVPPAPVSVPASAPAHRAALEHPPPTVMRLLTALAQAFDRAPFTREAIRAREGVYVAYKSRKYASFKEARELRAVADNGRTGKEQMFWLTDRAFRFLDEYTPSRAI